MGRVRQGWLPGRAWSVSEAGSQRGFCAESWCGVLEGWQMAGSPRTGQTSRSCNDPASHRQRLARAEAQRCIMGQPRIQVPQRLFAHSSLGSLEQSIGTVTVPKPTAGPGAQGLQSVACGPAYRGERPSGWWEKRS